MPDDFEQDLLDGLDVAREIAEDAQQADQDSGEQVADVQPVDSGDVQPEVSTTIRDRLVEKGFKSFADLKSDDEVIETLEGIAEEGQDDRVIDKYRPYIEAGREYLQQKDEFERWRASQQADQKPQDTTEATSAEQPVKGSARPEYDERWEQLCEYNPEIGQFVVKEQYRTFVDNKIGEKLTAHKDWERKQLLNVAHNFDDLVQQRVQEIVEARLNEIQNQIPEKVKSIVKETTNVDQYEKYMEQNSSEFWVRDEQGNFKTDPITGDYLMTKGGEQLLAYYDEASRYGIQGEQNLRRYAIDKYVATKQTASDGKSEEKAPEEIREEKKRSYLVREEIKKNAHSSNRSDSEIAEEAKKYLPDDVEEVDLEAIFRDELSRANITLSR